MSENVNCEISSQPAQTFKFPISACPGWMRSSKGYVLYGLYISRLNCKYMRPSIYVKVMTELKMTSYLREKIHLGDLMRTWSPLIVEQRGISKARASRSNARLSLCTHITY